MFTLSYSEHIVAELFRLSLFLVLHLFLVIIKRSIGLITGKGVFDKFLWMKRRKQSRPVRSGGMVIFCCSGAGRWFLRWAVVFLSWRCRCWCLPWCIPRLRQDWWRLFRWSRISSLACRLER